ncbi:hypothetical protein DBV15_09362 [Temnothorax longispinosus]|uniref:Uncharacterized protein n=1 Tax=Temnothorax longispinosus TaxID=300112 RepID=A0A4S2KKI0_9HYME|nr:hypothetical protein DBV15_09362 [Temnothorax longispinosus]
MGIFQWANLGTNILGTRRTKISTKQIIPTPSGYRCPSSQYRVSSPASVRQWSKLGRVEELSSAQTRPFCPIRIREGASPKERRQEFAQPAAIELIVSHSDSGQQRFASSSTTNVSEGIQVRSVFQQIALC